MKSGKKLIILTLLQILIIPSSSLISVYIKFTTKATNANTLITIESVIDRILDINEQIPNFAEVGQVVISKELLAFKFSERVNKYSVEQEAGDSTESLVDSEDNKPMQEDEETLKNWVNILIKETNELRFEPSQVKQFSFKFTQEKIKPTVKRGHKKEKSLGQVINSAKSFINKHRRRDSHQTPLRALKTVRLAVLGECVMQLHNEEIPFETILVEFKINGHYCGKDVNEMRNSLKQFKESVLMKQ
jgi:hypothetical protein